MFETIVMATYAPEPTITAIQKSIDTVRNNANNNPQIKSVLLTPQNLTPKAKPDVKFNMPQKEQYSQSIYGMTYRVGAFDSQLTPVIEFDMDKNKPVLSILNTARKQNLIAIIEKVSQNFATYFNNQPQNIKSDTVFIQSMRSTANKLDENVSRINQNGDFHFSEKDVPIFLNFLISHELAHLSFKDLFQINFDMVHNINVPQEKRLLSNAILSINKGLDGWKNEGGFNANYSVIRDEIHSDIAGMFTASYIALKDGSATESDLKRVFNNMAIVRKNGNLTASINGSSSHNTQYAYEPNVVNSVISLAKEAIGNPNTPVYNRVLEITENVFIHTLKRDGIVIKENTQITSNNVQNIQNHYNIKSVYTRNAERANKMGVEEFANCNKASAYRDTCMYYTTGSQRQALDTDNNNSLDFNNLNKALEAAVNSGKLPRPSAGMTIQDAYIAKEAEVLEFFAKNNGISIRTTNELGNDIIELKPNGAQIKF